MGDALPPGFDVSRAVGDLERRLKEVNFWYTFWFILYVVMGLATIILPGLSAVLVEKTLWVDNKILAGLGAVFGTATGFLKPNDYASGFDLAWNILAKTKADLELGLLDAKSLSARIGSAEDAMTFKYGGVK